MPLSLRAFVMAEQTHVSYVGDKVRIILACNDRTANTASVFSVVGCDISMRVTILVHYIGVGRFCSDTDLPFSPKISTRPSWILSANPGYF